MDIEALRRVNELTKALQAHGMSTSSQDALAQAETIIQPIQERQKVTESLTEQQTPTSDALVERKYKLLLEMNNKKFEETFSTMQNNINTLSQEIARLKTEISLLDAKRIVQEQAKPEIKQTEKHEQSTPQQTQETKKDAHPRQGNFAPGDISIEKMFYYGHK